MNTNETDVYLMRKTSNSWRDLGKLNPSEYAALLKEVYYQESIDEYRKAHSVASILAAIYNTIPRKRGSRALKASDFLRAEMPAREGKRPDTTVEILAKQKGIILPSK